jgi:hypothetical protein
MTALGIEVRCSTPITFSVDSVVTSGVCLFDIEHTNPHI